MRQIFVFGSNLAGRHGKGAAKHALTHWKAEYGNGRGIQGNSYAIPTKDENLNPLPFPNIRDNILEFLEFAKNHPDILFSTTPIGTGLANQDRREIAEVFLTFMGDPFPDNVVFTSSWFDRRWWDCG